jgi:hypothetical protein
MLGQRRIRRDAVSSNRATCFGSNMNNLEVLLEPDEETCLKEGLEAWLRDTVLYTNDAFIRSS